MWRRPLVPQVRFLVLTNFDCAMNIQSIGESAGIVWRVLHGDNRKWEYQELKKATGLRDRELNSAIGWLAREGKIQFDDSQNKDQQSLYIELSLYIG